MSAKQRDGGISWTDATWSPVRGCSRVSPGCLNCYAMGQAHRFSGPGKAYEGLTTIRRGKVDWMGHARLVPKTLAEPLSWRKPQRIFVNSMSDLFHHTLSNEEIAAVFGLMAACQQHTFQVLTKRPERAMEWFKWVDCGAIDRCICFADDALEPVLSRAKRALKFAPGRGATRWPLPNVWLGVSIENQKTADDRIPILLECPAAVRFVSAEPLLEPVAFDNRWFTRRLKIERFEAFTPEAKKAYPSGAAELVSGGIDQVIIGGESGPGARPFDIAWARDIVRQCREAGVAAFVKQLGARPYQVVDGEARVNGTTVPWAKIVPGDDSRVMSGIGLKDGSGGDQSEWPEDLRVREFPRGRSA